MNLFSLKKKFGIAFLLIFSFFYTNSFAQTKVIVDPTKKYQTFEGFGSSLCWWAVKVGAWDEANRNKLLGAVADPDTGLGYNIFRYNIGGGDNPSHNHLTKGDGGAKVPGYKTQENGNYDWEADIGQRTVAVTLAKMAKDPIFEAFSNSPPWWMTNSGCVSGGNNGVDNLKSDYFDDFADYLSEVAKHFKEEWGINFRTLEPFNEPSAGWWKSNGDQEGCGFKNKQSEMIVELGKALKKKGLFPDTKVSAADESNISDALSSFNGYSAEAISYLGQINTHSYSGYDSRAKLYNAVNAKGLKVVQSESGPLHKGNNSENIAIWMAGVIIDDIRTMRASAWVDWQLGDPSENWQTFALNHKNQSYQKGVRYYMHASFSRALRPMSRIIDSDNQNTIAAIRPDSSLVLIVRNNSSKDIPYEFDLNLFESIGTKASVNLFELPGSLEKQNDIAVTNKVISMNAKANSITTMIIENAKWGECTPSDIISYVKVGANGWNESTEVETLEGDSLILGPHPYSDGFWSWSGPNNYAFIGREAKFKNLKESESGYYTGTYINAVGCESSVKIKLKVGNPPDSVFELPENDGLKNDSTMNFKQKNYVGFSANLVQNNLYVTTPQQQLFVFVYDMQGNLIQKQKKNGGNYIIKASKMNPGTYILLIKNNRGNLMFKQKFVL